MKNSMAISPVVTTKILKTDLNRDLLHAHITKINVVLTLGVALLLITKVDQNYKIYKERSNYPFCFGDPSYSREQHRDHRKTVYHRSQSYSNFS